MAFIGSTCLVIWPPTSSATSRSPWDPFFGDGTRRVLDSDVSRAWTISDAGLGAVSYMLEALSGLMGGKTGGGRCRGWSRCLACSASSAS